MAERNWDLVNDGLDILHHVLVLFVVPALSEAYGEEGWWSEGVEPILTSGQRDDFEELSGDAELIYNIDVALALRIIERRWDEVFGRRLPPECLEWVDDLKDLRNEEAHRGVGDCSVEEAVRWLDTMQRLCSEIDPDAAECIGGIRDKVACDDDEGRRVGAAPLSMGAGDEALAVQQNGPTTFRLSARFGGDHAGREAARCIEEVISRLEDSSGVEVDISLDVEARVVQGFDTLVQVAVADACRAFAGDDFEFC